MNDKNINKVNSFTKEINDSKNSEMKLTNHKFFEDSEIDDPVLNNEVHSGSEIKSQMDESNIIENSIEETKKMSENIDEENKNNKDMDNSKKDEEFISSFPNTMGTGLMN